MGVRHLKSNIIKKLLYLFLILYALVLFASVIASGTVLALVFVAIIAGYIITMFVSVKCASRLEKCKEKILLDFDYKPTKKENPLFNAMMANLPFYYIYFVLSLVPMKFPALWMIAGLPCCFISALRPINKNYQVYNFITNKSKLYWLLQLLLAAVLWIAGRSVILFIVLK